MSAEFKDIHMRTIEAFDKDATAIQFLRDDGEGGFASGIYRMAREIDRLRIKCGEPPKRDPSWQDREDAEIDGRPIPAVVDHSEAILAADLKINGPSKPR